MFADEHGTRNSRNFRIYKISLKNCELVELKHIPSMHNDPGLLPEILFFAFDHVLIYNPLIGYNILRIQWNNGWVRLEVMLRQYQWYRVLLHLQVLNLEKVNLDDRYFRK